jgi:hypothetical protein
VGPRAVLDDVENENSYTHRDLNSDPSVVQPVTSRYTDYALFTYLGIIVRFDTRGLYTMCCRRVGLLSLCSFDAVVTDLESILDSRTQIEFYPEGFCSTSDSYNLSLRTICIIHA